MKLTDVQKARNLLNKIQNCQELDKMSLQELWDARAKAPKNYLENRFCSNAEYAYLYARYVIKGRWEKGEDAIRQDAEYAYRYAKNFIKGPWEKGEDAISKSVGHAYYYAKDVIKGAFEKGEDAISKDNHYCLEYAELLLPNVSEKILNAIKAIAENKKAS